MKITHLGDGLLGGIKTSNKRSISIQRGCCRQNKHRDADICVTKEDKLVQDLLIVCVHVFARFSVCISVFNYTHAFACMCVSVHVHVLAKLYVRVIRSVFMLFG